MDTDKLSETLHEIKERINLYCDLQELILSDILRERMRQNIKFTKDMYGSQAHTSFRWLAILGEEVGEANEAALDISFKGPSDDRVKHLRDELIQVAAVAVAIVERIDDQDTTIFSE